MRLSKPLLFFVSGVVFGSGATVVWVCLVSHVDAPVSKGAPRLTTSPSSGQDGAESKIVSARVPSITAALANDVPASTPEDEMEARARALAFGQYPAVTGDADLDRRNLARHLIEFAGGMDEDSPCPFSMQHLVGAPDVNPDRRSLDPEEMERLRRIVSSDDEELRRAWATRNSLLRPALLEAAKAGQIEWFEGAPPTGWMKDFQSRMTDTYGAFGRHWYWVGMAARGQTLNVYVTDRSHPRLMAAMREVDARVAALRVKVQDYLAGLSPATGRGR